MDTYNIDTYLFEGLKHSLSVMVEKLFEVEEILMLIVLLDYSISVQKDVGCYWWHCSNLFYSNYAEYQAHGDKSLQ